MQQTQKFILILVGILATASVVIAGFVSLKAYRPEDQLSVTAEGKVFALPTLGEITLGVKSENMKTAEAATKDNVVKMNKIQEAIRAVGVEEKDIKTTSYNLYPQYNYTQSRGQQLTGWTLEQMVSVKVRKLDTLGDVIAKATAAGANQAGGVSFTIDDKEALKAQARADAIVKAKAKAQGIAGEAGIRLGKIVNIYLNDSDPVGPYYDRALGLGGGGGGPVSAPDVQPGQNEVMVSVTLVYKVR